MGITYVETIANADPTNATAIAASAGMVIKKAPLKSKNDLNFRKSTASGSVVVMARVGTRQKQAHDWEYSVDGGKTWLTLPTTMQAKVTITGLTTGSTVLVKHRAVEKTGTMPWSDAASSMVT